MEIKRKEHFNLDDYYKISKIFRDKHSGEMEDLVILEYIFNSVNDRIKLKIEYSADGYRFKDKKDNAMWIDVKYSMVNTKSGYMNGGMLNHYDSFRVDYNYGKLYNCNLVSEMFYNLEFAHISYKLDKIKKIFNRMKLLKEIKK